MAMSGTWDTAPEGIWFKARRTLAEPPHELAHSVDNRRCYAACLVH
ncbi:hypothetical protein SAMN05444745_10779 [Arthrobacter sp. OV608]|nr:hypothetical protein SAMN05444745_10779 [Arthrobacter sp. OV608]